LGVSLTASSCGYAKLGKKLSAVGKFNEIADLLRHRSIDTASAYARVT